MGKQKLPFIYIYVHVVYLELESWIYYLIPMYIYIKLYNIKIYKREHYFYKNNFLFYDMHFKTKITR